MKKSIPLIVIILVAIVYLYSEAVAVNAYLTLKVIATVLFPALFPFMLFTQLLLDFGGVPILGYLLQYFFRPVFNLSGESGSLVLLGAVSGFPYTAVYGVMLSDKEPQTIPEVQAIVGSIYFPSSNFVLVTLAALLGSHLLAFKLLIALYLSGALLLFLRCRFQKRSKAVTVKWKTVWEKARLQARSQTLARGIKNSISQSTTAFINLAGIVLIFATLAHLFQLLIPSLPLWILPLIELTTGMIKYLDGGGSIILIPTFLSLCGISVLFQAYAFISGSRLNFKQFLLDRLAHAGLNTLILMLLLLAN